MQITRTDLSTTHEEADIIIVRQVIHAVCHASVNSISVVSDDTDLFLLRCHYYNHLTTTCQLTMEATSGERKKIDIAATVEKHRAIVPQLLKAHDLSDCDIVAYLYGIVKAIVVKKVLSGMKLIHLGNVNDPMCDVVSEATCYSIKSVTSLSDARIAVWKKKLLLREIKHQVFSLYHRPLRPLRKM